MGSLDANKFLRWSIPGWVAILTAIIFVALDVVSPINGTTRIFNSLSDLLHAIGGGDALANILIVALAGIPLGFLIYQFYFFVRWNSPFSKKGLFPPFIVGREADLQRTLRDIPKDRLNFDQVFWRQNWLNKPAYDYDHSFKWQYIESLFTEITQKIDTKYRGVNIYKRYRYLLDMMHTLGSSLVGTYLGFFIYLIILMRSEKLPLTGYVVIFGLMLLALLFFLELEDVFHHNQQNGNDSDEEKKTKNAVLQLTIFRRKVFFNYPSFMFMILFGMIIFFVSPSLLANRGDLISSNYLWRIVLVFLVILITKMVKWSSQEESWSAGIILFVGLVISLLIRFLLETYIVRIDWSFVNSLYIFLGINLVLLKNRQNARDDLAALQYYTFQRFFEDEKCCTAKVINSNLMSVRNK